MSVLELSFGQCALTRPPASAEASADKSGTLSHRMGEGRGERARSGIRNPKSGIDQSLLTSAATAETYAPKTLGTVVQQRGRLPPTECVRFGLNLTLALGHLHRHGLIDRDIKPPNIIFVQGIPKLADIGLVTTFDDTCSFVGREGFIAPEGPTSPRADLFSLGKVLYEISTGK